MLMMLPLKKKTDRTMLAIALFLKKLSFTAVLMWKKNRTASKYLKIMLS